MTTPTEKILVAIHGIGDQVRCETIQAVAAQLYGYYGLPPSPPWATSARASSAWRATPPVRPSPRSW